MSALGIILGFFIFLWIVYASLRKEYHKGLDEFNKEQEKIKSNNESIQELTNEQYDVIAGLHTLGYSQRQSTNIIKSIPSNNLTAEELLREALRRLQRPTTIINIRDSIVQRTNFNPVDDTKKVKYIPQTVKINPLDIPEPLRRLTQWYPIITEPIKEIVNAVIQPTNKPDKLLKPKVKRACLFERLTKEDMSDLKNLLSENIFKQFSYISLAWLKTKAIRQGIDDWISLIDSKLSYEENATNIRQQYGISLTDKETMVEYERAEAMRTDFYQGIGDNHEYDISR